MIERHELIGRVGATLLHAATVLRPDGSAKVIAAVHRPDSVGVLPVRIGPAGAREVLLVAQPRPVVGATRLVEVPAGKIDAGETPAEAAARELAEETGLVATGLVLLAAGLCVSPGYTTERMHLFAATVADHTVTRRAEDAAITSRWLPINAVSTHDLKTVAAVALAERDPRLWREVSSR